MNPSKEHAPVEAWMKIARKDWRRAERNLRDEDPEAAGFFRQQCLEKYFKVFLFELDDHVGRAGRGEGYSSLWRHSPSIFLIRDPVGAG